MTQCKVPAWLTKEEEYLPPSDKDTFINKSIYALLRTLSRVRSQGMRKNLLGVSPSLHLACTLIMVVLIAVSRNYSFTLVAGVFILLLLGLMKGEEIIKILKISFIVVIFSFIVLSPSLFFGNHYSIVVITTKIFATVTIVNILSHSVPWHSLTSSMKRFFVPDLFIFVLDITLKYIFMLGEFSLNMLYSLKVRSIGRNKDKYTALSGIAGTIFVRSIEMSQEMHAAMECRGFNGRYAGEKKVRISIANIIYVVINCLIVFTFLYLRSYD
jgi:cobalt/nickel transport system permease protein